MHKIEGTHLQCVNNHYAKFEYKGMKSVGVTDYTNKAPQQFCDRGSDRWTHYMTSVSGKIPYSVGKWLLNSVICSFFKIQPRLSYLHIIECRSPLPFLSSIFNVK